jgi:hypothetical protein
LPVDTTICSLIIYAQTPIFRASLTEKYDFDEETINYDTAIESNFDDEPDLRMPRDFYSDDLEKLENNLLSAKDFFCCPSNIKANWSITNSIGPTKRQTTNLLVLAKR